MAELLDEIETGPIRSMELGGHSKNKVERLGFSNYQRLV